MKKRKNGTEKEVGNEVKVEGVKKKRLGVQKKKECPIPLTAALNHGSAVGYTGRALAGGNIRDVVDISFQGNMEANFAQTVSRLKREYSDVLKGIQ